MKKLAKLSVLILLAVAIPWQAVPAQDFNALLNAVEKFDAELKQLVQQEAATRTNEIAALQSSMHELQKAIDQTSGEAGTDWSNQIAELTAAILEMKADLMKMQTSDDLSQELVLLQAEVASLKSAMHGGSPALASTDPDSYSLAMGRGSEETAENSIGGIEWSGFFDVIGGFQSSADDETEFGLGQAEIDLASELSDRIAVEAAVAYNGDDGVFELGAALIDIHPFCDHGSSHVGAGFSLDHSFILAGQFDVPFGIDYHVYPSVDRKLVTAPAVVDLTHGGWNDLGFQLGLELSHGNFVFYMVNGFEASAEVLDEVQTLATGVDVYEEVDTSPANAIGTRLGIAPFSWLEVGTSFATGWNASGRSEMTLVGTDLQFSMFNFDLKGEYIAHSLNRSIAEENNRGYYTQLTYNILDRAFVATRYGSFKPEGADWVGQTSIGAGYVITDGVELRMETVIDEAPDANQTIFQLAAGF
jgi:hypothetical protein